MKKEKVTGCVNINGYQPSKDYPHLIKNIDRLSPLNTNMKCGKDKVCVSEPSRVKDIVFYICMGVVFALLLAGIIFILYYFRTS